MAIPTTAESVPVVSIPPENFPLDKLPPEKLLELQYEMHRHLLERPVITNPNEELPEEDGVPLETDWHRLEMNLLIECVTCHFQPRDDYYVGGNMFIIYNEGQARKDFRGPDFFFARDVPLNPPRRQWAVWKENYRFPNVIVELTSPSTERIDRTVKKDIYEKVFRTNDYFIVDPDDHSIRGWHLVGDSYVEIAANERGWLWCAELRLWLGNWQGKFQEKPNTYARFFDEQGRLIPLFSEVAEEQRKLVEAERARVETERQLAEAERRRADEQSQRADALEAELAKLKAQLGQQPKNGKN